MNVISRKVEKGVRHSYEADFLKEVEITIEAVNNKATTKTKIP